MEIKRSFWKRLFRDVRSRYRIVIMNDTTFEEKASFSLTRLNVFIALSSLTVFLIFSGVALIAFTPVKEYLNGCNDVTVKNKLQLMRANRLSLNKRNLVAITIIFLHQTMSSPCAIW